MPLKVTPADRWFSKCVRARARWRCERCGAQHSPSSRGLHTSHHHRRGEWAVRFHPWNAEALCYGCHSKVGGTGERMRETLTERQMDILLELMRDKDVGREARRTKGKGEIARHYRREFERIENHGGEFTGFF